KQKKKDRWRFRHDGDFAIAGLIRADPQVGEAWTMLTVPPGEDIAPYHNRQIALLTPPHWRSWLDGTAQAVPGRLAASGGGMRDVDVILKRFETPDEVRESELGRFEVVNIGGM